MPQSYIAYGDAYTRRYNETIKAIPRKAKIIDDILLHNTNIKGELYHTFNFLLHWAKKKPGSYSIKTNCNFAKTVLFKGPPYNNLWGDHFWIYARSDIKLSIPKNMLDHGLGLSTKLPERTH